MANSTGIEFDPTVNASVAAVGATLAGIAGAIGTMIKGADGTISSIIGTTMVNAQLQTNLTQATFTEGQLRQKAGATQVIGDRFYTSPKANLCPLAEQTHMLKLVHDGKGAIRMALTLAINKMGADGNNPLAAKNTMDLLCKMGFVNNPSRPGCSNSGTYANGQVWSASSVVFSTADVNATTGTSDEQYPWPSVIALNPNGMLTIQGTPQAADMPALAAIWFCALRHPPTGKPLDNNSTTATAGSWPVGRDSTFLAQQAERAAATGPDAACIDAVADRLQIPASVTSPTLQLAHNEQVNLCTQYKNHDIIDQAILDDCTTNGRSFLQLSEDKACPGETMSHVTTAIDNGTYDGNNLAKGLEEVNKGCREFLEKYDSNDRQFLQTVQPTHEARIVQENLDARPQSSSP